MRVAGGVGRSESRRSRSRTQAGGGGAGAAEARRRWASTASPGARADARRSRSLRRAGAEDSAQLPEATARSRAGDICAAGSWAAAPGLSGGRGVTT